MVHIFNINIMYQFVWLFNLCFLRPTCCWISQKEQKKKRKNSMITSLKNNRIWKTHACSFFSSKKGSHHLFFFFYMLSFAIAIGDRPVGHIFFFYPVCHVHPLQCYCLEHLSNRQLYKLIHLPFFCEFVLQLSLVRDDW